MAEGLTRELMSLVRDGIALLKRIDERQGAILRLQAIAALEGKPQREQIERLYDFGLQPRDIAQIVGTSSNTVRVALVRLRKSRKPTPRN